MIPRWKGEPCGRPVAPAAETGDGASPSDGALEAVKLRDLAGNVHTVPFGEVTSIVNMTRGFSYYLLDIGVAYREDVDRVMAVIAEIGLTLQQDKPYADLVLAPIEILGVDAFTDSAVVIKAPELAAALAGRDTATPGAAPPSLDKPARRTGE